MSLKQLKLRVVQFLPLLHLFPNAVQYFPPKKLGFQNSVKIPSWKNVKTHGKMTLIQNLEKCQNPRSNDIFFFAPKGLFFDKNHTFFSKFPKTLLPGFPAYLLQQSSKNVKTYGLKTLIQNFEKCQNPRSNDIFSSLPKVFSLIKIITFFKLFENFAPWIFSIPASTIFKNKRQTTAPSPVLNDRNFSNFKIVAPFQSFPTLKKRKKRKVKRSFWYLWHVWIHKIS